jgi:hypothetical protein
LARFRFARNGQIDAAAANGPVGPSLAKERPSAILAMILTGGGGRMILAPPG